MRSSVFLVASALLALFVIVLGDSRKAMAEATATVDTPIALSGDVATGIFLGFGLIGMLVFAVTMLMQIEASDKLGQPKSEAR